MLVLKKTHFINHWDEFDIRIILGWYKSTLVLAHLTQAVSFSRTNQPVFFFFLLNETSKRVQQVK